MILPGSRLVVWLRLVERLPVPAPPAQSRGRPRVYSDRLFFKALVVMFVGHLSTVVVRSQWAHLTHGRCNREGVIASPVMSPDAFWRSSGGCWMSMGISRACQSELPLWRNGGEPPSTSCSTSTECMKKWGSS